VAAVVEGATLSALPLPALEFLLPELVPVAVEFADPLVLPGVGSGSGSGPGAGDGLGHIASVCLLPPEPPPLPPSPPRHGDMLDPAALLLPETEYEKVPKSWLT